MLSQRMDTLSRSFSKSGHRVTKPGSFTKENRVAKRRHEARLRRPATASSPAAEDTITNRYASIAPTPSPSLRIPSSLDRSIITLVVGADQRLFAAHEDVLCKSPFFHSVLRNTYAASRIALPDEEPEILSSVLEFLYMGDYHPRLVHDQLRNSWELESAGEGDRGCPESIIYHRGVDGDVLKDTVVYCAAEKYGLAELKKLALRKQGLRSGIQCSTILASARYAYANTPDSDSKLRAHYLALIIRSRSTFKRSGTMQLEMYNGGTQLFFDLFVALCNHVDDISSIH